MDRIFTDTTNFFAIDYGDIIEVEGKRYLIKGHEREERFGLDEPKFWVKKGIDMENGERKILKLAFFEQFETSIGVVRIPCFRNPEKEAQVLDLVKNHPHFMHGKSYMDSKANSVRVIDIVPGMNLYRYVESLAHMDHKTYFFEVFPGILLQLIKAFHSLRVLHASGLRHGDVRNDHIIIESGTGNYVWIDFDYDYESTENPFSLDIMGLGNILLFTIGKGFHNLQEEDVKGELVYRELREIAEPEDFSILHKWRFMNLKKLYPYIPNGLNDILGHFTLGANIFYESVDEVVDDLKRFI